MNRSNFIPKAEAAIDDAADKGSEALKDAGKAVERGADSVQRGLRHGSSELSAFLDDLSNLIQSNTGTDVRGEIEKRIDSARTNLRDATQTVKDAAYSLSDSIGESGTQLAERARHQAERARHQVERSIGRSRETVADYPLSAIAVAATGGLIVGLLLASRR